MWLFDLTTWLQQKYDQLLGYFDTSIAEFFEYWNGLYEQFTAWCYDLGHDAILALARTLMTLTVAMLNELPVPDFLSGYSLNELLGNAPAFAQYIGSQVRLPECFALIAAGYLFRITRKVVTLGRW